jgi:hypothetical protein
MECGVLLVEYSDNFTFTEINLNINKTSLLVKFLPPFCCLTSQIYELFKTTRFAFDFQIHIII